VFCDMSPYGCMINGPVFKEQFCFVVFWRRSDSRKPLPGAERGQGDPESGAVSQRICMRPRGCSSLGRSSPRSRLQGLSSGRRAEPGSGPARLALEHPPPWLGRDGGPAVWQVSCFIHFDFCIWDGTVEEDCVVSVTSQKDGWQPTANL